MSAKTRKTDKGLGALVFITTIILFVGFIVLTPNLLKWINAPNEAQLQLIRAAENASLEEKMVYIKYPALKPEGFVLATVEELESQAFAIKAQHERWSYRNVKQPLIVLGSNGYAVVEVNPFEKNPIVVIFFAARINGDLETCLKHLGSQPGFQSTSQLDYFALSALVYTPKAAQ